MDQLIYRWLLTRVLFVPWVMITCWPVMLLILMFNNFERLPAPVGVLLGLLFFGELIACWWLSKRTAHYILDEHLVFLEAIKRTWFDARLHLAFIPVIGLWFTPDEDKTKYDDGDDDIRPNRFDS